MEEGMLNIPGLDVEQGLETFDGEMDDYMTALYSFIKNTPEILNKLRNVTEENLPDYAINVHGLKSISGWICAEDIRRGAAELEALAKAGDLSGVLAQSDKYLNDVDAFIKDLDALLKKNSEE
jgi:HPt (histidine-containing phosphotransfer) domain-containing protein